VFSDSFPVNLFEGNNKVFIFSKKRFFEKENIGRSLLTGTIENGVLKSLFNPGQTPNCTNSDGGSSVSFFSDCPSHGCKEVKQNFFLILFTILCPTFLILLYQTHPFFQLHGIIESINKKKFGE